MSSTSSWFGTDYYHPVDAVDTSRPCKSFRHRDRLASIDLERSTPRQLVDHEDRRRHRRRPAVHELSLVIGEWLARIPNFEVASGVTPQIAWSADTFGLTDLPLQWRQ